MLDSIKIKMVNEFNDEEFVKNNSDIYTMVAANNGYFLICILDEQTKDKLISDTDYMGEFIKSHADDDYDAMSKLSPYDHNTITISSCIRLYNPCINYARIIKAEVTSHGAIKIYETCYHIPNVRLFPNILYYNNTSNGELVDKNKICRFEDYTIYVDDLKRYIQ